ncbi:MAG: hypothetical protein GXO25_06595 [Euryarchaeota archaeon]|nr:hypothetical protein [Euryarchaeota archaeon]
MKWQIGDKQLLLSEKKGTWNYYLIGGGLFFSFFIIYVYFLLIFNFPISLEKAFQTSYTYFFVFSLILLSLSIMLVGGLVSITFAFTKPAKVEAKLVKYISFLTDSIEFTYFDGHTKKISYDILNEKAYANIGFTNVFGDKTFDTLRDFFEQGVRFIEDTIKRNNKNVYPVITIFKNKSDKVFEVILSPYSLDLNGFFNDWFEKYNAYLENKGDK